MNGLAVEAKALADAIVAGMRRLPADAPEVLVCPPATVMLIVAASLKGSPVALGGQDCSGQPPGAHTGDIAATMLTDLGCRYVILGHSERRADHQETDGVVRAKAEAAQAAGLIAIVCVGETLAERDAGRTLNVISQQVHGSVPKNSSAARSGHRLRAGLGDRHRSHGVAGPGGGGACGHPQAARRPGAGPQDVRILYGGSVKGANARELLAVANVDGALVGGASLKADEFLTIAAAAPAPATP